MKTRSMDKDRGNMSNDVTHTFARSRTSGAQFARAVLLVLLVGVLLPVAGSVLSATVVPEWRWDQVPFHSAVEVAGGLFALALAVILLVITSSTPLLCRSIC